jgi:hypothetical protein
MNIYKMHKIQTSVLCIFSLINRFEMLFTGCISFFYDIE